MSLNFPTSEFFQNSGNATASFTEQLRDGIASHACSIWSRFPRFVTRGRNPLSSFARGYMNQMCSGQTPPPVLSPPPFTGGQCCDKTYIVDYEFYFERCIGTVIWDVKSSRQVDGAIRGMFFQRDSPTSNQWRLFIEAVRCNGTINRVLLASTTQLVFASCATNDPTDPKRTEWNLARSYWRILSVTPADGSPDNCGNPASEYPPEPTPQPGDLSTTITITNLDGVDNTYDLTWNQINNNYNFPMGFRLGGVNVTLDVGGITIHGDTNITTSGGNNSSPPPGSEPATDEQGNEYIDTFPDGDYPVLPDLVQPETIEDTIEYLVCNTGVLDTVTEGIRRLPGTSPIEKVLQTMLEHLLREVCGSVNEAPSVGFPEYYPVIPGTERPAIVYYYKEVVNGALQRSTYTSTVSNPKPSVVSSLDTLVVPDKRMGKYVCSIVLTDGTRIRASGTTETSAIDNYLFLLNQVPVSLIPPNEVERRVIFFNKRLHETSVKCTQIEYYPNGKASGVSPAYLRKISAT